MAELRLCDLRAVRKQLAKSQVEMASLLGVSTRAVQSYEQGWRATPSHVQKMCGLLLYLDRRNGNGNGRKQPCWQLNDCHPAARERCPAWQFQSGDLCWMVMDAFEDRPSTCREANRCESCPVMIDWLGVDENVEGGQS